MLTLAPVFRIGGHYRPLLVALQGRCCWSYAIDPHVGCFCKSIQLLDDCRGFDTGGGGVRTSCIGVSSQFDHKLAAAYCVGFFRRSQHF